jgi:hypothetical protein
MTLGLFVNFLIIIEQKISSLSFQKCFYILFALMVVKVGIWQMPNLGVSLAIAQHPFVNVLVDEPGAQYLMFSWFSSFVAWLLHLKKWTPYFLFHLMCSVGFVALFAKMVFERHSLENAKKALILFFLFPFSATSFFWVGMDSATLLLMMLSLYFYKNEKILFLFAVMLGLQHFEQAFFSALALLFPIYENQSQEKKMDFQLKNALVYFAGILVGKLILFLIFKYSGVLLVSNRAVKAQTTLQIYFQQFFFHFQVILWSICGVGWLAVIRYYQWNRTQWPVLISILGIFLVITPIIGDQTRVDCIILFPLICVFLLNNHEFLARITMSEMARIFVLWLLIPWVWVWGQPRWSVFPYDVCYLVHKIFHQMPWPANASMWPFV